MMKTLYLFIDESGNFDPSTKGSKYFTLTALATFDPVLQREQLIRLRYDLLKKGIDQESFHATEDIQHVRNQVFGWLALAGDDFEVHSVYARKDTIPKSLFEERYERRGKIISRMTGLGLYQSMSQTLLKHIFDGKKDKVDTIVIVLGSIFVSHKRKALLQTLKHFLKTNFPEIPFEIYFHSSHVDLNSQLADYCCWALSIKRERSEVRPYHLIKQRIKSDFEYV